MKGRISPRSRTHVRPFGAIEDRRVRLVEGVEEGHVAIEGTPDVVLEVVSTRSVRKDTNNSPRPLLAAPASRNTRSFTPENPRCNSTSCAGCCAATRLRGVSRAG